jgi:hypothetical protein
LVDATVFVHAEKLSYKKRHRLPPHRIVPTTELFGRVRLVPVPLPHFLTLTNLEAQSIR